MNKKISIYNKSIITRTTSLSIVNIGDNINNTLEYKIKNEIEGMCIVEGFVKPNSTKIISHSSGTLSGGNVIFEVVFECLVCSLVEGMNIDCIVKNITETAGIRAETNDNPSPIIIYIARDHHYNMPYFSNVKVNQQITVKVIGQRYELNDKYISVIAELLEKKTKYKKFILKDKLKDA
jgi:DNA-directed RNA polymerase subunit E'/Rpb7